MRPIPVLLHMGDDLLYIHPESFQGFPSRWSKIQFTALVVYQNTPAKAMTSWQPPATRTVAPLHLPIQRTLDKVYKYTPQCMDTIQRPHRQTLANQGYP